MDREVVSTEVQAVLDALTDAEREAVAVVYELTSAPDYYIEGAARMIAHGQTGVPLERIAQIRGQLAGAVARSKIRQAAAPCGKDKAAGE